MKSYLPELCELDNTSLVPQHTGKKYLKWLLIGQMVKWKYNTMSRPIQWPMCKLKIIMTFKIYMNIDKYYYIF